MRANARATQSKNNLAQMGEAMKHYEGQGHGNLRQNDWLNKLLPYLDKSDEVFLDPADTNGLPSYVCKLETSPTQTFAVGQMRCTTNAAGKPRLPTRGC